MAWYDMRCGACGHAAEVEAPITQGPPEKCPECGAAEGDGWGQDWANKPINGFARNTDTVGYLAERNEKRLGKELTQKMWDGEKKKRKKSAWSKLPGASTELPVEAKKPWWRDGSVQGLPKKDKPVNSRKLKTKEQVEKYIHEGKEPL